MRFILILATIVFMGLNAAYANPCPDAAATNTLIEKTKELGLFKEYDIKLGAGRAVIDGKVWNNIAHETKLRFIGTLYCKHHPEAGDKLPFIYFVDHRSGKDLFYFDGKRLRDHW